MREQDGNETGMSAAVTATLPRPIHARTLTRDDWRWFWMPDGHYGAALYSAELFARFLAAAGYADGRPGVPPELPDWAVDETEEQHRKWRRRGIAPEITYFAKGKYSGRIKIGMTTQRPEVRVSQLRFDRANGEDSELVATRRGGHFERVYHQVFETWRVGGEWFAPHPDILAEIERLNITKGESHV